MIATRQQNYINHIALVLDASGSMSYHKEALVRVADQQIAYLAQRSKELDQETRVTVYTFDNEVRCLIYDKDVLRLPSIKDLYRIGGMTALIDATVQSQVDLGHTWEGYGDHSFLTFVLTDGQENRSRMYTRQELAHRLEKMPENWTVAVLVPDQLAKREAQQFGFPKDNIAIWDTTSERGVEEAVDVIRTATDTYMTNRSVGIRGSRSLFVGGSVDVQAVKQKLTPLAPSAYDLVPITKVKDKAFENFTRPTKTYPQGRSRGWFVRIDDFINHVDPPFRIGKGYYQLFSGGARKSEKVQGNKQIAVMDKKTSQVYVGPEARKIVGLPDYDVTVKADTNPDYEIFVRSTSDNRQLPVGTKLLIMKN